MSRYLYSVEAIEAELLRRIKDLVGDARLPFADGERRGTEWAVRLPGRHKRGSMSINLISGVWSDFSAGTGARAMPCLALVAAYATNGDFTKAIYWAKDWLGWTGEAPDPAQMSKARELAEAARLQRERQEAERAQGKLNAAFHIWLEARRLDGQDPASLYLKGRGIDAAALPDGRFPRSLKFHPGLSHPHHASRYPALVACMSLEGRKHGFGGVHRIYLERHATGWGKAFGGEGAKIALGYARGASIRLSRGAGGRSLAEAPAGESVMVTEGIEDGLALAIACPEHRVLAVYALAAIGLISLPPHIGEVIVVGDNDEPGSSAAAGLQRAAELVADRHQVRVAHMPENFKDVNDALLGKSRVVAKSETLGGAA